FTLALTAVGFVLFGSYALLAYRTEREELRASTTREIAIVGRSLEISLANALRDGQRADIDKTLVLLDALAPNLDIHLLAPDGRPTAHSKGARFDDALGALAERALAARDELVVFDPPEDPDRLVFAAPLTGDDGTLLGSVAIARPVDDLAADLA